MNIHDTGDVATSLRVRQHSCHLSLKHLLVTGIVLASVGWSASLSWAAGPLSLQLGRKQLFLDNFAVEQITGLARTMHQPEKKGAIFKPIIELDGLWAETRSTPIWIPEEGVYKIIYVASPTGGPRGTGVLVSKDGLHWERPSLGLFAVKGSKDNNRISAEGMYYVVRDPDDPDPSRRYKGLVHTSGASGVAPYVSADMIHWKKLDVPPIPSSDEASLTYDREKKRFIAMVKGGNQYGRAFNISFSEDFVHWTQPRFCFGADAEDQRLALTIIRQRLGDPGLAKPFCVDPDPALGWKRPEAHRIPTWRTECYNIGVFPYEGVYIGIPMMFYPVGWAQPTRNNSDGFDLLTLVMSRDLVNWERLGERRAFIGPSRIDSGLADSYDRMQLTPPNCPVEIGDKLYFYYGGLKQRCEVYKYYTDGSERDPSTLTPEEKADLAAGMGSICLAVLRKDGFVSLDAGEKAGTVLTKPLKLTGDALLLNLDAGAGGSATVEILDEGGKAIPGFSGGSAVPVTGDGIRLPVKWAASGDIGSLAEKVVRLKIHLKNASLYAFWTE
jgi:hypothetical protein